MKVEELFKYQLEHNLPVSPVALIALEPNPQYESGRTLKEGDIVLWGSLLDEETQTRQVVMIHPDDLKSFIADKLDPSQFPELPRIIRRKKRTKNLEKPI